VIEELVIEELVIEELVIEELVIEELGDRGTPITPAKYRPPITRLPDYSTIQCLISRR